MTIAASFADACDRRGRGELVRVGPSGVCAGVGLFAARAAASGSTLTAYPFVCAGRHQMRTRAKDRCAISDYVYTFESGATVDGDPRRLAAAAHLRRRRGARVRSHLWGCAHLANDAIHPEVTGRANNCEFVEVEGEGGGAAGVRRLYLVTTRDVRRGEELLVPYSFQYWLSRASRPELPPALREWLGCHERVRDALEGAGVRLGEYVGACEAGPEAEDTGGAQLEYTASFAGCKCAKGPTRHQLRRLALRWHPSGDGTQLASCCACGCVVAVTPARPE
jgi:hypothetical protein